MLLYTGVKGSIVITRDVGQGGDKGGTKGGQDISDVNGCNCGVGADWRRPPAVLFLSLPVKGYRYCC